MFYFYVFKGPMQGAFTQGASDSGSSTASSSSSSLFNLIQQVNCGAYFPDGSVPLSSSKMSSLPVISSEKKDSPLILGKLILRDYT